MSLCIHYVGTPPAIGERFQTLAQRPMYVTAVDYEHRLVYLDAAKPNR